MKYIIVSIFLILSAASICQANVSFDYFYNEQRPGGDYERLKAHNVDECSRACANDRRCQAFDFDTYERQCWLKDRIPKSRYNRDVVSGVKRSDREKGRRQQREIAGLLIENDTTRSGGDYKTLTARNLKECARACANDQTCQSFNYGEKHGDCWLKYNVPDGDYSDAVISGYKTRSQDTGDDKEWTTGEVAGLFLENNTQRKGENYKKMTVKNARACVKLCAAESICRSFNYVKESRVCRLKKNISKGIYNDTIISGYKTDSSQPGVTQPPTVYEVAGLLIEDTTKRRGGDYKKFVARNVNECARACANDGSCKSFNYDKELRGCWLKHNIPDGVYDRNVMSGYKAINQSTRATQKPKANEVAGMRLDNNVKRNGGDYTKFTVKNVKECATACANDNKCRSFNYGKKHRDCWLKRSVPKGVHNTTVISGVKPR